jgi:hypothetical protein
MHTPLPITNEILQGFEEFQKGKDSTQPQSSLTWVQFFQGIIDVRWETRMENEYSASGRLSDKQNGRLWCKSLIMTLWDSLWEVWHLRNEDQYARDEPEKMSFQRSEATNKITSLYAYAPDMSASDRSVLLQRPLEELLIEKTYVLRDWLETHAEAIISAVRNARATLEGENRKITQYKPK